MNEKKQTRRKLLERIQALHRETHAGDEVREGSFGAPQLESLLMRQYESLDTLHQITLDLLSQRDLREMLQFIVDQAARLLDATYCEMLLPEGEELVAKAYTRNAPFPSGNRFRREDAPLGWKVFDSGVPAVVADYSTWGPRNRVFEDHHFHAAASIPIRVGEKCIGVLGFARTRPGHHFTEENVLTATRFAAVAALAMENSRLYHEIEMVATTDELTGIRNRRSLLEIGEKELRRALRYARPLSMLMLDVDHFKQVNDTWGHAGGDQVLRGIASQCQDQIRATDTVGRYGDQEDPESLIGRMGGEEFVILLPETAREPALIVAERIRAAIESMSFAGMLERQGTTQGPRVTVSIGVSTIDTARCTLNDLLVRADEALYEAKKAGRNRVRSL